ncbi:hypothetical protein MTO96_001876 [Rhipicephalus appendiculatus]
MASKRNFDPAVHWFPDWDNRTRGWPLVGNPIPLIAICLLYVYAVKIVGPKWMRDRKPFELRALMAIYNFALVIVNSFFVWAFVRHGYIAKGYKVIGQSNDYSTDPPHHAHRPPHVVVLRTPPVRVPGHGVLRDAQEGQTMFVTVVNSSVHVVMYSYYFLSGLGPAFQRFLWWKRYLTQLQLTQFVTVCLHSLSYLYYKEGTIPGFTFIMVSEAAVFLVWFLSFYSNAYRKGGRSTLDIVSSRALAAKEALAKVASSCCPEPLNENKDE